MRTWEKIRIKEAKSLWFGLFRCHSPTPCFSPAQQRASRRHVHACVHAYIAAWRVHTCRVVERAGGTEDNSNDCTNPLVSTLYKSRARTVLGNNGPQRVWPILYVGFSRSCTRQADLLVPTCFGTAAPHGKLHKGTFYHTGTFCLPLLYFLGQDIGV